MPGQFGGARRALGAEEIEGGALPGIELPQGRALIGGAAAGRFGGLDADMGEGVAMPVRK